MNEPAIPDSFSQRMDEIQQLDEAAIANLWNQYYPALVCLAEKRLAGMGVPQRAFNGEDVAASAMASFFRAVQKDRFSELKDEDGLFRLLKKMTIRKVIDRKRQTQTLKVGGGKLRGESAFGDPNGSAPAAGIEEVPGDTPSPDWIAMMEEECKGLFAMLDDENLQTITRLRLEGHSNVEIAAHCNCSLATIERRLKTIRACWSRG